jgi:hypothetical protein
VIGYPMCMGREADVSKGFHAAINVALDLDERVMPKGPMFPRSVAALFCKDYLSLIFF